MKAIIIDDPGNIKFSENLSKIFNKGELYDIINKICYLHSSDKSPREIAEELNIVYKSIQEGQREHFLLLINIEGKYVGANRLDQKGAEILMWLRCKHLIANPVILYGFQSNCELLKQKPEHLTINSKGCYYYRLPYDFRKIIDKPFKGLEEDDWEMLKQYLKPMINLESLRHQYANYWGIKQMWDVHKIYYSEQFQNDYPNKIKDIEKQIDFCTLEFINGMNKNNLHKLIENKRSKLIEENKERLKTLNEVRNKILEVSDKVNINNELILIDEEELNGILNSIRELILRNIIDPYLNSEKHKIEKDLTLLKSELEVCQNKIKDLNKEESEIEIFDNIIQEFKTYENIRNDIDVILDLGNDKNFKILQIDDQASDGWEDILRNVIYGNTGDNFKSLKFDSEFKEGDCIEDKLNSLLIQIKCDNKKLPNLILLDLRIFPAYDSKIGINAEEISGIKLLQKLKIYIPQIPIIITTASNKVWSIKEIIKSGADAYWIKEGIDDSYSYENTIKSYNEFISLVKNITGLEFTALKNFGENIAKIKENPNLWWKSEVNWGKLGGSKKNMEFQKIPITTKPEISLIVSILDECFILYREYLQREILETTFNPNYNKNDWLLPSLIIQHASKIVELIHDFKNSESVKSDRRFSNRGLIYSFRININEKIRYKDYDYYEEYKKCFIPCRMDRKGAELFDYRNLSSHTSNISKLNFSELNKFIVLLLSYLNTTKKNFK